MVFSLKGGIDGREMGFRVLRMITGQNTSELIRVTPALLRFNRSTICLNVSLNLGALVDFSV